LAAVTSPGTAWVDRSRRFAAVALIAVVFVGCGGSTATPTPCVVSYPPAVGANVILFYPNVSDAQCSGKVDPVPGAARLLAVPTGQPLCSGTTPNGDSVRIFSDSIASRAMCGALR
jgi:hypothetical protein